MKRAIQFLNKILFSLSSTYTTNTYNQSQFFYYLSTTQPNPTCIANHVSLYQELANHIVTCGRLDEEIEGHQVTGSCTSLSYFDVLLIQYSLFVSFTPSNRLDWITYKHSLRERRISIRSSIGLKTR